MDHTTSSVDSAGTAFDHTTPSGRHDSVVAAVRRALDAHGRLTHPAGELPEDADLATAGLSSHATVNVMLAIEDDLDVELPDRLLTRATFATIATISVAVEGIDEGDDD